MKKRPAIVPDVLAPGLRLVFCGTAPSKASAAARAYYARPGNRFWPILHAAGFTPTRLRPAEYATLIDWGIGLTDLCKGFSGNDDELPDGALDARALREKLEEFRPAAVAFTSKCAAKAFLGRPVDYGWQRECVGPTRLYVLPSPSGQAVRYWDEAPWRALAAWCQAPVPGTGAWHRNYLQGPRYLASMD